jgi:hypothetical protein
VRWKPLGHERAKRLLDLEVGGSDEIDWAFLDDLDGAPEVAALNAARDKRGFNGGGE